MTKKNNGAPRSGLRPGADELEALTPGQRQFAAVLGDLLAARWFAEQRELGAAPPTAPPHSSTSHALGLDRNSPAK